MIPSKTTSVTGPGSVYREDLALADRCRAGDFEAFEALYREHASRLFGLTVRMLGNRADAEDMLQDIFLTAHRKLESYRGDARLGTWLFRLATNLCLDHLRSKAARMTQATASLDEDGAMEPVSPSPGPVVGTVQQIDMERAVAKLPKGCRAAFLLHDVEGFEHREVASMLGISEGTSKSQVHKARLKLRRFLAGLA
ncbi:MAG: RNA polymerase sigma factor [Acidobacteriota bacterium]|nr:RNA polymerase sigma factor [Acidobacteriota bacterium]